ncbi:uncharacterized protein LOC128678146 [Plodia interpunctella]|uniref:uncharacterized protein LOC128678146 n=1 Tax=Plodia interpunctella TaxID=58824 RepID=UPI0023679BB7|nr:uncharacterized protein LOC128678146 [Plodia interpunctella]
MLNLLVILAASLVPLVEVHSNRLSRSDIDAILNIIQTQQQRSDSDSDSGSYERLALRNSQLVNLLHRSLNEEKKRERKVRKESKLYRYDSNENVEELNRILDQNKDDDDDDDSYLDKKKIRPYDLLQKRNDRQKSYNKNKLLPNNLLETYQDRNERSLSDYSKVYIILNPDAVRNSQNKRKIANLISRLLSRSSQTEDDLLLGAYANRQNRRDGAEKGAYMKDSFEERPKRPRYNNYGGGGGGGGGRTAIPYIRNRGDIYVRDRNE